MFVTNLIFNSILYNKYINLKNIDLKLENILFQDSSNMRYLMVNWNNKRKEVDIRIFIYVYTCIYICI
jgi:hypothetical protein